MQVTSWSSLWGNPSVLEQKAHNRPRKFARSVPLTPQMLFKNAVTDLERGLYSGRFWNCCADNIEQRRYKTCVRNSTRKLRSWRNFLFDTGSWTVQKSKVALERHTNSVFQSIRLEASSCALGFKLRLTFNKVAVCRMVLTCSRRGSRHFSPCQQLET